MEAQSTTAAQGSARQHKAAQGGTSHWTVRVPATSMWYLWREQMLIRRNVNLGQVFRVQVAELRQVEIRNVRLWEGGGARSADRRGRRGQHCQLLWNEPSDGDGCWLQCAVQDLVQPGRDEERLPVRGCGPGRHQPLQSRHHGVGHVVVRRRGVAGAREGRVARACAAEAGGGRVVRRTARSS